MRFDTDTSRLATRRGATRMWALCLGVLAAGSCAAADQPLGCLIEPSRVLEIGSPVTGVLRQLHVDRGTPVRKGQLLAVLRSDVEVAQLSAATSRAQGEAEARAAEMAMELAARKQERTEDLHKKEFVSIAALEQAVGEADLARARVVQAHEQLRHYGRDARVAEAQVSLRQIRSPIDGVVVERYLGEGEHVDERPILRIAALDPLRAEVVLPASMFGEVAAGIGASVRPDLANMAQAQGTVTVVDRLIDPASNTFRVRVELPNADGRLPAGLRCKVQFAKRTDRAPTPTPSAPAAPVVPPTAAVDVSRLKPAPRRESDPATVDVVAARADRALTVGIDRKAGVAWVPAGR